MENIANKISQIANNSTRLYEAGYNKAQQENAELFFATSQFGDDTCRFSCLIPFEPDKIAFSSFASYPNNGKNTIQNGQVHMQAYEKYAGAMSAYGSTHSAITNVRMRPSQISTYFTYDPQTQVFTIDFSAHSTFNQIKFRSNIKYYFVAQKLPDYSIVDAVTEEIELLPDEVPSDHTGTLLYNQQAIYSVFTEGDWEALTFKKPKWTFVLE